MKRTSLSNREQRERDRERQVNDGGELEDRPSSRDNRDKNGGKSHRSSIRFSDQAEAASQRSKSRHSDYGQKLGRENSAGVYGGGGAATNPDYYSASLTGGGSSLSSTLDEMMLDMSSSSTIVECYCGQNSCPQCNLLLKMAGDGSDG